MSSGLDADGDVPGGLVKTHIEQPKLSEAAHRAIRHMILSSELQPGARLVVRLLSERFGLSPTPIKEALVALEREGLVVAQARRGYSVANLDVEDVRKLYQVREAIEGLAARLAAERADGRVLKRLEQAHKAHIKRFQAGDLEGSGDTDLAFHQALWEASENEHLIQVAATFPAKTRLAMTSIRTAVPERHERAVQEHEELLQHIRAGNPEQAERLMREHIRRAAKVLTENVADSAS